MYPFYMDPPAPKRINVGTHYRKRGETMDWKVVEVEDDRVVLQGPGYAKGLLYLDRSEFDREWSRA